MMYGVEARSPPPKQVKRMQKIMNGYERALALGPRGETKIMKGKLTQSDIRVMLGTYTVQLETDIRMLKYVGHISLLEDRWEYKVLFGKVEPSSPNVKSEGKDS